MNYIINPSADQTKEELQEIVRKEPYNNEASIKLYWMLSGNLTPEQTTEKWEKASFAHDSYCAMIGRARSFLKIHDPMADLEKRFPGEF